MSSENRALSDWTHSEHGCDCQFAEEKYTNELLTRRESRAVHAFAQFHLEKLTSQKRYVCVETVFPVSLTHTRASGATALDIVSTPHRCAIAPSRRCVFPVVYLLSPRMRVACILRPPPHRYCCIFSVEEKGRPFPKQAGNTWAALGCLLFSIPAGTLASWALPQNIDPKDRLYFRASIVTTSLLSSLCRLHFPRAETKAERPQWMILTAVTRRITRRDLCNAQH